MTPQTNVRLWWDASIQAYRLSSPFNKTLVDVLKQHIPGSDRSLDPATKIWTFTERFYDPFVKLLASIGIQPTTVTRAQSEAAQGRSQAAGKPAEDIAALSVSAKLRPCLHSS